MDVLAHAVVACLERQVVVDRIGHCQTRFEVIETGNFLVLFVMDGSRRHGFFIHLEFAVEHNRLVVRISIYVLFAHALEIAVAQSVIDRKTLRNLLLCADIERVLERIFLGDLPWIHRRGFVIRANRTWIESVINRIEAITEREFVRDVMLEIVFEIVVLDIQIPIDPNRLDSEPVIVIAVNGRRIRKILSEKMWFQRTLKSVLPYTFSNALLKSNWSLPK